MTTFRIELPATGRWLASICSLAPIFTPVDHFAAEFPSRRVAEDVLHRIESRLPTAGRVVAVDWAPRGAHALTDARLRMRQTWDELLTAELSGWKGLLTAPAIATAAPKRDPMAPLPEGCP